MPRPLRSHQPDGHFHVTTRGNRQAALFLDPIDHLGYLERLGAVTSATGWHVLAYCLMPNHSHLLVSASVDQLSRGMQRLSGWYAQRFNYRHSTSGHTFQGRFFSEPTLREEHLLEVVRYIASNPVRAGLCERPQDWRWSAYGALIGRRTPPEYLDSDALLALFGAERSTAVARLRQFVELAEPDLSIL